MGAYRTVPPKPAPTPLVDLAEVYAEHADFVWRVVRRMGVDAPAVPDVVQDVFLVVHRRLADFDGRASVRAWLAGITRGVVSNHRRSRVRERRRLELLTRRSAHPEAGPDRRLELGRAVASFLDTVDEDQRMAVVLTDIEGLTPAEAAVALGVSRNTVYSRLRLAREKLRRHLEAIDTEGGDDGR